MLRRAESELNTFKAIENLGIISDNNELCCTEYHRETHSEIRVGDPEYNKICSIIKLPFYFDEIEDIIVFEFRRYHEDYSVLPSLKIDWETNQWPDTRFSSILEAHQYNKCNIINNLKDYLDDLFDGGYRLVKNMRIRDNIKRFVLNRENVLIVITIDYGALSEYGEIISLLSNVED
jgi:hypothetical protein